MRLATFTLFVFIFLITGIEHIYAQPSDNQLKITELSSPLLVIGNIEIKGNKVTQERIIRRELTFKEGDTITTPEIEIKRSCENLLNRSLFNFVTIDTIQTLYGLTDISISVEERWYTWPGIIINQADRNFSSWLKSRDLDRLRYGFLIDKYNFRGANETLKFKFVAGFAQEFSLDYKDIFLDRKRQHSMSFSVGYKQQSKLPYHTIGNKQIILKHSQILQQKFTSVVKYSYRAEHYNRHTLALSYNNLLVADTVVILNNDYLGSGNKNAIFFSFEYSFERNKTDSRAYPLKGHTAQYTFVTSYPLNPNKYLNQFFMVGEFTAYWELGNRFYFASGVKAKKSFINTQSYMLRNGFGYRDNLRGFEYYVVDGESFVLCKNNLKFNLLPTQVVTLNYFPFNKFPQFNKVYFASYINLFFDWGYVNDHSIFAQVNPLTNKHLYSYGIGVDWVTYYDKVFRFDFVRNSLNEYGFFISFKAAI